MIRSLCSSLPHKERNETKTKKQHPSPVNPPFQTFYLIKSGAF